MADEKFVELWKTRGRGEAIYRFRGRDLGTEENERLAKFIFALVWYLLRTLDGFSLGL